MLASVEKSANQILAAVHRRQMAAKATGPLSGISRQETIYLIELIQGHEAIWNGKCAEYRNQVTKKASWKSVVLAFQARTKVQCTSEALCTLLQPCRKCEFQVCTIYEKFQCAPEVKTASYQSRIIILMILTQRTLLTIHIRSNIDRLNDMRYYGMRKGPIDRYKAMKASIQSIDNFSLL